MIADAREKLYEERKPAGRKDTGPTFVGTGASPGGSLPLKETKNISFLPRGYKM